MNSDLYETNQMLLQSLMQQAGIDDLEQLSKIAQVSRWQLIRIQRGLINNLTLGVLLKIAQALQISLNDLVHTFVEGVLPNPAQQVQELASPDQAESTAATLAACQQEYQRLQVQLEQQQAIMTAEFQRSSIVAMESWLLQWPTAAMAVRQNPQLPASRLLALVEPVEQLLQQWGVEAIAQVGDELPYDPQFHQLMKGIAQPEDLVKVRYVGYKQGDKILYKAKVSPV